MENQKNAWETSYRNLDNFVFYPHEEIIRFVSRYIRKRIGLREFRDVIPHMHSPRVLDLGCGIGRHVIYFHEMGFDCHGIDLSATAVEFARQWGTERGITDVESRIVQGDVRSLPWPDASFDVIVSHGVLDSMPFEVAKTACQEAARILRENGLLYCDVVSGDDSTHAREFAGEEIVATPHEQGTIQSYFNFEKILELIERSFDIIECKLIRQENVLSGHFISRYHLSLKRK